MIRVLGGKRVVVLALFIGLNVVFASALYMHFAPLKIEKEREQRVLRGRIAGLSADIDRLQIEFDQLEDQRAQYESLREQGFFDEQNRRNAEKLLEKVQKEATVISAVANIQAGEFVSDPEAQKSEHKILASEITVKLEALEDADIYRYIYLVKKYFPGRITLTEVSMERAQEVNATVLRAIADGKNIPLIEAEIKMLWRTMIPDPKDKNQGGAY